MTARRQRDFLKSQLAATQGLLESVADHPLMSRAMRSRVSDLERQIEELPLGQKEARAVLLFSGEPVQGSFGIDADFAGRVLGPFQNMVMTEHANRHHGLVGKRGKRVGESESRLLLTALPRGSFGLELTKAEDDELFEEDQLADTLAHVTKLVESASKSDEEFASQLDDTSARAVQSLLSFLEVIAQAHAGLSLETGDLRTTLSPIQAKEAYDRVSDTVTSDEVITEEGVFRGGLLESWRFDFLNKGGHKISGRFGDNLSKERATEMVRKFTEMPCTATLELTTVRFKNGRVRTSYKLTDLTSLH